MSKAADILVPHNGALGSLVGLQELAYSETFFPLGFAIEVQTNSVEVLEAASASWSSFLRRFDAPPLRLRIRVNTSGDEECPATPEVVVQGNVLSIIADAGNVVICNLNQGVAFGNVSEAVVRHPFYLRYHFLEAAAYCLLCALRVTALHAACVSYAGEGLLLCGESGAGKSTLSYACARAGWAFTSDDASYLLWNSQGVRVRGGAHQVRFRPSAAELFPEVGGRAITPRAEGKPSIEVPTAELPGIVVAEEAQISGIVLLNRQPVNVPQLVEADRKQLQALFRMSLFGATETQTLQRKALERLYGLPLYELRYSELDPAIARLQTLVREELG